MQPAGAPKTAMARVRRSLKPEAWVTKTYDLFFIDPVSLTLAPTNNGNGYQLTLPADWVVKYGPAIQAGTSALRFASAIGRVVGLPLPNPSQYVEGVLSAEATAISSCITAIDDVLGTDGTPYALFLYT